MNDITTFDYTALANDDRILVQQRTTEIRDRMGRAAQNIVEIGTRLIEVKERLGHGAFGGWLEAEFDWSEPTAQRMMRVASRFESVNLTDLSIAPSALYLLASPSTPDDVRETFIDKAHSGEPVKHADVKAAIEPPPARRKVTPVADDLPPDDEPCIDYETGEVVEDAEESTPSSPPQPPQNAKQFQYEKQVVKYLPIHTEDAEKAARTLVSELDHDHLMKVINLVTQLASKGA